MNILNFRKNSKYKAELLFEVNSYLETNLQQLYSYTAWACGNKSLADKVMEQALNKVEKSIHSNLKIDNVIGDFHKILKSECDIQKLLDTCKNISPSNTQQTSVDKNAFQVLINKVPEKYSQPLTMQIIGRFSVSEISNALEINNTEALIRLSAGRKLLAGFAALEQPQSCSSKKIEMAMIAATNLHSLQPTLDSHTQITA